MKHTNTSTASVVPMKGAVLGALAMAWAWGVIAGSVGLNALIKSNQEKSRLKSKVPPPTAITIDDSDVFRSGVVLTTVAALIAVLCSTFFLMYFLPFTRGTMARSLRVQSFILAFCGLWLFAALVPFTVFFATRSAQVTASIGGIQLPPQAVQQAEMALGSTSVYRRIGYLRLVAILPWITLLFTVIAAVVLFMAGSRARRNATTAPATTTAGEVHDSRSDAGIVEKDAIRPSTTTAPA